MQDYFDQSTGFFLSRPGSANAALPPNPSATCPCVARKLRKVFTFVGVAVGGGVHWRMFFSGLLKSKEYSMPCESDQKFKYVRV